MLGSLARRRCSLPKIVRLIKSHRVHDGEFEDLMKKEIIFDCSVFFCMSLYTSFCDVTTRSISTFQPYQQSPFHLFWGRGHMDWRERIFVRDGAFALNSPKIVRLIKSHRMHDGEFEDLMKKEIIFDCSVFFCMSLYTSFCDVTTRSISNFQPYQQSPFHLFWGRGHMDWRERIFVLDGAFALTLHVISSLYLLMQVIADSLIPHWLQTAVLAIPLHNSTYVTLPRHNWITRPKLNAGNWENHNEEHYCRGSTQPTAYYSARLCKHDRESRWT